MNENPKWKAYAFPGTHRLVAMLLLISSMVVSGVYYLRHKTSFFDDAFIYLHMAQNAAQHGTWQYFPITGRPALLASSPLKLVLDTVATLISVHVIGVHERTLFTARLTLFISGVVAYLLFSPFWRKGLTKYFYLGSVYFLLACPLDTIFDFEGGLLYLWVGTLIYFFDAGYGTRKKEISFLLTLGPFIRPDMAVVVYSLFIPVLVRHRETIRKVYAPTFLFFVVLDVMIWIVLTLSLRVYPIPVTWWAKSALQFLFDKHTFLESLFPNLGIILVPFMRLSESQYWVVGFAFLAVFVATTMWNSKKLRMGMLLSLLVAIALFSKLPSNYWWYYQNLISIIMGISSSLLMMGRVQNKVAASLNASTFVLFLSLLCTHYWVSTVLPWDFSKPSRAQGYMFLASRLEGGGTYSIPELGQKRVFIKNPEIGITAYFGGYNSWIWDSGGLAQTDPRALGSVLKWLYPRALWLGPEVDARKLANGRLINIYDVWAMDDRNFLEAAQRCQYINRSGALCINPYGTIE